MPTIACYVPAIVWREFRALVDPNHQIDDKQVETLLREVMRVGVDEWIAERKAVR